MTSTAAFSSGDDDDAMLVLFRDMVGRFLDRHATPDHLERWREQGVVDRVFWKLAGEAGLLSPSVPEEFGGAGSDFRYELTVIEELGRRGLEGFGAPVHSGIVTPYIAHFATDGQKRAWLPGIVSGDIVLAVAMSEPGAGSDLKGIRTRAVRDGDSYIIDGQKTFISNGQTADLVVIACRTGEKQLSLFLLETEGAEGFTRGRNLHKMGREAQDTSELFFEGVRVPANHLLGEVEGQGFAQLTQLLAQERLVIAAMAQVMMERAVDLTVQYTKDRKAFGQRLFDFQNTQFTLADCRTQAVVGRTFLDDAVKLHLGGRLDATRAAMVKLWISETQFKVIDACLQFFGGYGYMDEYPISRLFRDARIDRIHGGASEIMKMIIARSL
jgi:acyl-CoA dehydrogenase